MSESDTWIKKLFFLQIRLLIPFFRSRDSHRQKFFWYQFSVHALLASVQTQPFTGKGKQEIKTTKKSSNVSQRRCFYNSSQTYFDTTPAFYIAISFMISAKQSSKTSSLHRNTIYFSTMTQDQLMPMFLSIVTQRLIPREEIAFKIQNTSR